MKRGDRFGTGSLFVATLVVVNLGCGAPHPAGSSQGTTATPALSSATVVVISVDTLRADRVGCYGRPAAGTAHLDALAASGARFSSAETTAPLTLCAHSSLLTGRTVPAHGVLNNGTYALPEVVPTLAEAAKRAGFSSGAFVSSAVLARRYGLARGFDRYDDQIDHGGPRQGLVVHYDERSGRETVARTLGWVRGVGDKPLLLFVHLWEPHAPYQPPAEFAASYANDRYQGEVAAADAAIGQLLEGLRQLGRGDKRLVVVTADHGEGLGDHGEPTHGVFLYRETMRIPLLVAGSAFGVKSGVVYDQPVSLADVAPTVLELIGAPPLPGIDGRSLAPLLRGTGPGPTRPGVFAESHLPQLEFGWSGLRSLVAIDGSRLIDAPKPELYDERQDPAAQHNLAPTERPRVEARRTELDRLVRAARDARLSDDAERSASEEELAQLRSLGYAGTGRRPATGELVDRRRVDPHDRVEWLARFDEANAATRRGEHPRALALYGELVAIEPHNPGLLLQYGESLILAGKLAEGERQIRAALREDPRFGRALYRLAVLRDHAKDVAGAEAAYRQAIIADPTNTDVRKALAGLLTDIGRYREAIGELEAVKKLDPNDEGVARDLERLWSKRH